MQINIWNIYICIYVCQLLCTAGDLRKKEAIVGGGVGGGGLLLSSLQCLPCEDPANLRGFQEVSYKFGNL